MAAASDSAARATAVIQRMKLRISFPIFSDSWLLKRTTVHVAFGLTKKAQDYQHQYKTWCYHVSSAFRSHICALQS
jgi:hypothetical protein